MLKHITKIRPYRVFKKDGLHFVKINKKKVYIRHATKNKIRNGDKQIVKVVVNNLLAQRRSRQRKRKNKPVLAIGSTSKPATAEQPASGQSSGKIDPTKIPDSAGPQAPTIDPLYANANRRSQPPQIEGAPPSNASSNEITIKHDYTGMSGVLYDAYMLGKNERAYANQILGTNIGGDPYNLGDGEGFDMSNPDDKSRILEPPDLIDVSSPPDGASGASIATGEPQPGLLFQDATEEEQKKRRAEIEAEKEANTSLEEKQRIEAEEQQRQLDEQAIYNKLAEDKKQKDAFDEKERLAMEETIARRKTQAEKREEEKRQQQDDEDQHILTQLATSNALREKEAERTQKEEADDKRRHDELMEFEAKQKEKADKEAAEAAEASGASGASGAITRSTEIGTDLTGENIKLYMIRYNRENNRNYSATDLKEKISELDPNATFKNSYQGALIEQYVRLLLADPDKIPYYLEPRPDIREAKERLVKMRIALEKMTVPHIKQNVLPLFMKRETAEEDAAFLKITKAMAKDEFIEKVWAVIMADPEHGQKGWGLTNHTIKQEGMNSDEIAQVLKKKTHHVIPVIASDQIATLLPLVNNKTQHFGFVINSQSEKKPGLHWKAIYFDRKKAEVCYFDSLVSEPTEAVMRGIKQIMRKMADPLYFKFKINRIKFQADDSSTCGPFALKFIADMYAGKQFKVATRFTDQHVSGEKSIRKYISRWGYV